MIKALTQNTEGRLIILALASLLLGLSIWGYNGHKSSSNVKQLKAKESKLKEQLDLLPRDSKQALDLLDLIKEISVKLKGRGVIK